MTVVPKATVHIRDTASGLVAEYAVQNWDQAAGSTTEYIWSEGNYACDCNRGRLGFDMDGDTEADCGDSRFRIWVTDDATGTVIYDERTARLLAPF